jgi:hypothetical protein
VNPDGGSFDPSDPVSLGKFGVTEETLRATARACLDENGFLAVPGVLSRDEVRQLTGRLESILDDLGPAATTGEPGVQRFPAPILDEPLFETCWQHPIALAAAAHVLPGPFHTRGATTRNPLPGHGAQGLHQDAQSEVGEYIGVNVTWCIDTFTTNNGAPRAIPGSHSRLGAPFDVEEFGGALKPHSDEIRLLGSPGTLIAWNARLWHSGCENQSDGSRRSLV